jgi:hypothetical protein
MFCTIMSTSTLAAAIGPENRVRDAGPALDAHQRYLAYRG